jgi:hypothetical protein
LEHLIQQAKTDAPSTDALKAVEKAAGKIILQWLAVFELRATGYANEK